MSDFRVIGEIVEVETIAEGAAIRELARLLRLYGVGRWLKRKGVAMIELAGDRVRRVELHWYEAHGYGRIELKIKRFLDESHD